jgi:hypothetical protein
MNITLTTVPAGFTNTGLLASLPQQSMLNYPLLSQLPQQQGLQQTASQQSARPMQFAFPPGFPPPPLPNTSAAGRGYMPAANISLSAPANNAAASYVPNPALLMALQQQQSRPAQQQQQLYPLLAAMQGSTSANSTANPANQPPKP